MVRTTKTYKATIRVSGLPDLPYRKVEQGMEQGNLDFSLIATWTKYVETKTYLIAGGEDNCRCEGIEHRIVGDGADTWVLKFVCSSHVTPQELFTAITTANEDKGIPLTLREREMVELEKTDGTKVVRGGALAYTPIAESSQTLVKDLVWFPRITIQQIWTK